MINFLKIACLALAVAMFFPLSAYAEEYNPSAPSAAGKAAKESAGKSLLPKPVKTPSENTIPPKNIPPSNRDKFEYYDADKSGTLSYKEFARYSGRTKLQDSGLQKRFQRLDKNNDFELSFQEVKNWGANP